MVPLALCPRPPRSPGTVQDLEAYRVRMLQQIADYFAQEEARLDAEIAEYVSNQTQAIANTTAFLAADTAQIIDPDHYSMIDNHVRAVVDGLVAQGVPTPGHLLQPSLLGS